MSVNAPFGLNLDGQQLFTLYSKDQLNPNESRPFFVPYGYMRIALEEHRARCCPPGLYDLEPREMFQAVAMKFCPPNCSLASDAVVDLPIGDFTQAVVMRQPTWDIFELHLIVQARISKMKKFALANSSNPGAVVYMILRDEIVQQLQSSRSPYKIGSKSVLDTINQKTAEIGLTIRSIFVDSVVRDRRRNTSTDNASPVSQTRTKLTTESSSPTLQPSNSETRDNHDDCEAGAGHVDRRSDEVEDVDDDDSQYTVIQQPADSMK